MKWPSVWLIRLIFYRPLHKSASLILMVTSCCEKIILRRESWGDQNKIGGIKERQRGSEEWTTNEKLPSRITTKNSHMTLNASQKSTFIKVEWPRTTVRKTFLRDSTQAGPFILNRTRVGMQNWIERATFLFIHGKKRIGLWSCATRKWGFKQIITSICTTKHPNKARKNAREHDMISVPHVTVSSQEAIVSFATILSRYIRAQEHKDLDLILSPQIYPRRQFSSQRPTNVFVSRSGLCFDRSDGGYMPYHPHLIRDSFWLTPSKNWFGNPADHSRGVSDDKMGRQSNLLLSKQNIPFGSLIRPFIELLFNQCEARAKSAFSCPHQYSLASNKLEDGPVLRIAILWPTCTRTTRAVHKKRAQKKLIKANYQNCVICPGSFSICPLLA